MYRPRFTSAFAAKRAIPPVPVATAQGAPAWARVAALKKRITKRLREVAVKPRVPTSPVWGQTVPTITFIEGGGFQTHSIAPYVSDADTPDNLLTITKNATALPTGVTYNQLAQRYEYDGTSPAAGTNGHTLTADDAVVGNLPPVWQTSIPTQELTVGVFYQLNLDTYCSDPESQPLTYTIISGALPAGISQSGSRGQVISGTPTTPQGLAVIFRATDQ
jgi:hypothetical protein